MEGKNKELKKKGVRNIISCDACQPKKATEVPLLACVTMLRGERCRDARRRQQKGKDAASKPATQPVRQPTSRQTRSI